MLAVHLENGAVDLHDDPIPRRPEGFALMRLLCGGICRTDLELQRGYYGFTGTPGHEFVGEVVEADDRDWVGRRVVGEINLACGRCAWCLRCLGRHCPNRTVLGILNYPGAFREFLTLPERNLHEVPDELPTDEAVFVEPLAAAFEILDQLELPCNAHVAVLGDGKLGLLIALVLNVYGYRVHLYGKHEGKLWIARREGVATEVVHGPLPEKAYRWVVDATGSQEGLREAIRMTEPRGTVVLKSTLHGLVGVDTAPVIVNEINLLGSRCGRFEPAIDLLSRHLIPVEEMISDRMPLAEAPRAFARAAEKGVIKVLLANDRA